MGPEAKAKHSPLDSLRQLGNSIEAKIAIGGASFVALFSGGTIDNSKAENMLYERGASVVTQNPYQLPNYTSLERTSASDTTQFEDNQNNTRYSSGKSANTISLNGVSSKTVGKLIIPKYKYYPRDGETVANKQKSFYDNGCKDYLSFGSGRSSRSRPGIGNITMKVIENNTRQKWTLKTGKYVCGVMASTFNDKTFFPKFNKYRNLVDPHKLGKDAVQGLSVFVK